MPPRLPVAHVLYRLKVLQIFHMRTKNPVQHFRILYRPNLRPELYKKLVFSYVEKSDLPSISTEDVVIIIAGIGLHATHDLDFFYKFCLGL